MFSNRTQPHVLSILIADPTGGGRLGRMIDELRDLRLTMPLEVIGVIGGSEPAALAELQCRFPLVTLHGVPKGADIGALLSIGADSAQGRYVLILDGTASVDAAAITGMMQFLDKGQWVGAVGPRLETPGGAALPSSRAFPTARAVLDLVLGRQAAAGPEPRLQYSFNRQVSTPKEVDAIASRCCMVRRKALQEVGAWTLGYAPGGETLDWCKRAKARGWSMFYHPGVTAALHEEAAADPKAIAVELASAMRYMDAHAGYGTVGLLKLMLAAVSMRAMLVQGCASLLPGAHRASARFSFWRAWHAFGAVLLPRRATA